MDAIESAPEALPALRLVDALVQQVQQDGPSVRYFAITMQFKTVYHPN